MISVLSRSRSSFLMSYDHKHARTAGGGAMRALYHTPQDYRNERGLLIIRKEVDSALERRGKGNDSMIYYNYVERSSLRFHIGAQTSHLVCQGLPRALG